MKVSSFKVIEASVVHVLRGRQTLAVYLLNVEFLIGLTIFATKEIATVVLVVPAIGVSWTMRFCSWPVPKSIT